MNEPLPSAPQPPRPEGRARDHLANERTFLAWIRTALGLIGVGFILARMGVFLRQLSTIGGPAPRPQFKGSHEYLFTGVVFLLIGVAIAGTSAWAYDRSRVAIEGGKFEPDRHRVAALAIIVVLGGLAIAGLVIRQLVQLDAA